MKHSIKIILIILVMFLVAQLIGIAVVKIYSPQTKQIISENGSITNTTIYNLPYGLNPPEGASPKGTLLSIIIGIVFAVILMFILMRIKAELFLRLWFFFVVTIAIAITLNAVFLGISYSSIIALAIALPIAFVKIFQRNIIVHNLTELMIYPGIAAIFVSLLNVWTVILLLILISLYDIYAVWHVGFMQKMAKYQIQKLRLFAGFFIPYTEGNKQDLIQNPKKSSQKKRVKVNVAILGGGDVVFPIILAGVVFREFGLLSAIIISLGATLALLGLYYISKKGKFYPAMPFLSIGCFLALILVYLI